MGDTLKKEKHDKLARLKVQHNLLLKSCTASLSALRLCNPSLATELTTLQTDLEKKRVQEKDNLREELTQIFTSINTVEDFFTHKVSKKDFSAENCREKLILIQKKLSAFHETLEKRKKELREEEKKLETEVLHAQQRLETGEHLEKSKYVTTSSKLKLSSKLKHQSKDTDIQCYERFLEENGATGGWEEKDHLLFVRLRSKYLHKELKPFFTVLQAKLPDITLDQIKEHEEWYKEFEIIKCKYKLAITKWKEERNNKKKIVETKTDTKLDKLSEQNEVHKEKKKQIIEWRVFAFTEKTVPKYEFNSEIFLKFEQKQRELQQEKQKQEMRAQKEKEAEKRRIEREKKASLRKNVLQYQQLKKLEDEESKLERQKLEEELRKEKASEAKKLLKTYRKLDLLFIERKKLLRERPPWKHVTLPKVQAAVTAERDPNRLLQHTQVWQAHCTAETSPFKPILHLRNMPHLAVPQWRKGIK